MKREARLLLNKAYDSLVLSIELFNRPYDRGRISSTLIFLDHAFEMLLKSSIIHRGGGIRERRAKETIGFDACVRRSLTDAKIKYLTEEQALTLQILNGLRDAAQHHLLDISEDQLYVHVQSGITLFRDIVMSVFGQDLAAMLPARVLPVATRTPRDLISLFDSEITEIKKLLQPRRRHRVEAMARLRPIAILDATIKGEKAQPSNSDLRRLAKQLVIGKNWSDIFPDISAVKFSSDGIGPTLSLRLSKKEGIPIQVVPEGTPETSVVAVKRVNELGYYNLGAKQLAEKLGLTIPKLIAIVDSFGLRNNDDFYKEFRIGKSTFKRYSQKAIKKIQGLLTTVSIEEIWTNRKKEKQQANISTI